MTEATPSRQKSMTEAAVGSPGSSALCGARTISLLFPLFFLYTPRNPTHCLENPTMTDETLLTGKPEIVAPMSFSDKMTNIFMSPGEVYENVRLTPPTRSNWLVPTLLVALMGLIMTFAMSTNPSLTAQMQQQAKESMDRQFQKQVEQGKMTPEQANQARTQAEQFSSPTFMLISQGVAGVIGPFVGLVVLGLIYWLVGKWFIKSAAPFGKVLEVVGLANFIGVLDKLVTLIMQFAMDNIFATPSAGMFISGLSTGNPWHMFALSMNVFTFWELVVIAIGLSRLFQKDFPKILVIVAAIWLIWTVAMVFGLGALRG
jgi:hypothetical protein